MNDRDTLYARIISGDLDAEEIEHLKRSGEWDEIHDILEKSSRLEIPAYDLDQAYDNLKVRKKIKLRQPVIRLIWSSGIAAMMLLVLGYYFLFFQAKEIIKAPVTKTTQHILADQSIVVLNDGSEIAYIQHGWQNNRTIHLVGEAHFEVTKGTPFKVITGEGIVEVLGTSFNVRSWGTYLDVACFSGKVKVSKGEQAVVLDPGETVRVENEIFEAIQITKNSEPDWMREISSFRAEKLYMVFEELGRQYGVKIQYPDSERRFTGSFNHNSLQTALEEICKPMGLNHKINEEDASVTITD